MRLIKQVFFIFILLIWSSVGWGAYPGDDGDTYQEFTVQAGMMPSAESGVTLFIDLAVADKGGPDLWDTVSSSGGDLRVTDTSGNSLARCVVYFDKTLKKGILALKTGSVDVGSVVRVFYNGAAAEPAADATYGSQAAWDSSWQGAYFAKNKTVSTINDATANARHLTIQGSELYTYLYDSIETGGPAAHQGALYDGTYYYFIGTNTLQKRATIDGADVATNTNPCAGVNTEHSATTDHLGGGAIYNGYLYVPVNKWVACGDVEQQYIARYSITDLSYDASWSIGVQDDADSGLCINPTAGANGIIYMSDYCASEIHEYDLVTPSTLIGTISVTGSVTGTQGICLDGTEFVLGTTSNIQWVASDGTLIGQRSGINDGPHTAPESVWKYGDSIYQWGGDSEKSIVKISPINQNISSSLGPVMFVGTGTASSVYLSRLYTLPDVGTIISQFTPRATYADYRQLVANSVANNQWQSWMDSTGTLKWRTNATASAFDLDTIHATNSQTYTYLADFGWTKNGANAEQSMVIDGSLTTGDYDTVAWSAPGTSVLFNHGGATETTRGFAYWYFAAFRSIDLGKDADRTLTEYNSMSSPSTFWAAG